MSTTESKSTEHFKPIPPGGTPSVTDTAGFDRGTGTGEPDAAVAHNLRLMKRADDGYDARDWPLFLARWQDDRMVDECVLYDPQDIMGQAGVGQ